MCGTCGCNITHGNEHLVKPGGKLSVTEQGHETVTVLQNLLHENDHTAAHNREHFDRQRVLTINLMSSPGAGKTSLLEATIDSLAGRYRCAVVEGDLETENDADRIRAHGVPAVQITTGNACHLDAHMVHDALHQLDLDDIDILFIENVGNLVCPASFDLGQHLNVILLSAPEGDDKPAKYPVMFRAADLVLLSKSDLLPYLEDFDPRRVERFMRRLASAVPVLSLSCKQQDSMTAWLDWLSEQLDNHNERIARGETRQPEIQLDEVHLHARDHAMGRHR